MNSRSVTIILLAITMFTLGEAWYIVQQQGQIQGLNFRILSLQYQKSVLSSRCNALESNMSEVLGELEGQIKELQGECKQLKSDYQTLQNNYNYLEYDFVKLQVVNDELQTQFWNYSAHYKQLGETVNSRLALDGNLSRFVTPKDPAVIEKMIEITRGHEDPDSMDEFWADTRSLFDWIRDRISYGADSPYPYLYSDPSYPIRWFGHSVRFPSETLYDRTGDCEDQALLLLSLMRAYDEHYTMWCISIKWEGGGHIGVALPLMEGKMAILDPAGGYISGTSSRISNDPVEKAIVDWMDKLDDRNMSVSSIVNEKIYKEFDSTQEFIEWFNSIYS
jgi:hypothetical protein